MSNESTATTPRETRSTGVDERTQGRRPVQAPALFPAVDIVENDEGIVLTADMPGVTPQGLTVEVDHQILTISGSIEVDMPAGLQAVHAELRGTRYERRFTLSNELDPEAVEASLEAGVLTVRLPKKAAHKPRRIEIQTG